MLKQIFKIDNKKDTFKNKKNLGNKKKIIYFLIGFKHVKTKYRWNMSQC